MKEQMKFIRFFFLFVFSLQMALETYSLENKEKPGLLGEINRLVNTGKKLRGEDKIIVDPTKVIQLSWSPRAFLYKGFLSHEECDHLITLSQKRVKRSLVVGKLGDKGELSNVRTSSGAFIPKRLDPIIKSIEQRISAWTFLPEEHGENLQILRYDLGQKYGPHTDSFKPADGNSSNSPVGSRVATVLMYLSDVAQGGETVFPNSKTFQQKDDSWSECGKLGLGVKPVKGDALLFFTLHPNGSMDASSLHTGCPVVEGTKWSATKWIHEEKFERTSFRDPSLCIDEHPKCAEWAAVGECVRNPVYMVRNDLFPGYCRKSCNACNVNYLDLPAP